VIQGSYTKASATYTSGLAEALASTFEKGILWFKNCCRDDDEPDVKGLESQVVNSVVLSSEWKVDRVWTFKKSSHINILEFSVLEKLAIDLVRQGKSIARCPLLIPLFSLPLLQRVVLRLLAWLRYFAGSMLCVLQAGCTSTLRLSPRG